MFASDNWSGAHPAISDALARHGEGFASAYGASDLDLAVEARFNEVFEREVSVWFVATGTAANALAMAAVNRPGGVAFAHREAHVIDSECGAVEAATGGARLVPVDGALGRMDPDALRAEMDRFAPGRVHDGQPMAVTITQGTEVGTHYAIEDIERIAEVARGRDVPLHMDGARFANALAATGASPADMTWRAGVDVLSFGGTKNGCWCAEAIVFMDPAMARDMGFIRKRAAQLFSKTRFVAAQFEAHLADDLWLATARHANAMAAELRDALTSGGVALAWPTTTNEVFALLTPDQAGRLDAVDAGGRDWTPPHSAPAVASDRSLRRFVTSFATEPAQIGIVRDALGADARAAA